MRDFIVAIVLGATAWFVYDSGIWKRWLPPSRTQTAQLPRPPAKATTFELHSEPALTESTRALLYAGKYEELERQLEQLRQEAIADPANEHRLVQAYDAFDDAETRTREEIDAWIQARPESGEALIARAGQRVEAAWKRRGGGYSSEVDEAAMADFDRLLDLAGKDAEQALARMPEHPVAWTTRVRTAGGNGGTRNVVALAERVLTQAPASYAAHKTMLNFMQPRWGGSYEMMAKYAELAQAGSARNPRLAVLRGVPAWAMGEDAYSAKEYEKAREFYDRAMAFGEDSSFLEDRAGVLTKLNRFGEAVADLRRRNERWPSKKAAEALTSAQERMREAAYRLHRAGKHKETLEAYDSYLALWPNDEDVLFYQAQVSAQLDHYGEALRAYRRVIELNPTRFEAVKGADHTLARERRWDEILPLWEAYLALKPEHAEAYFERGGTYFQMGDLRNAYENAAKACELGHDPACAWRNRLKTHPALKS